MARSSKMVMSAEIITKKKHDMRIFRDCIRSDSEKGDIEKNQKITFLLISTNKYSSCPGIDFYKTAIIFLKFYEVLAKS